MPVEDEGSCVHYQPHEHVVEKVDLSNHEGWPRHVLFIDCPNCDERVAVVQTSYGARAECRPCLIRWTTLFSEERTWTDERYSPITDNTTKGRTVEDAQTARAGRKPLVRQLAEERANARAGSGDDG